MQILGYNYHMCRHVSACVCINLLKFSYAKAHFFLFFGCDFIFEQIKANGTLMQMVAADWLKSSKREDDLGGRAGGIVQVYI